MAPGNLPLKALEPMKVKSRIASYILTGLGLMLLFLLVRHSTWEGSKDLHTLMEVIATLLAFMVGVLGLTRYHTQPQNTILLIGVAFLGTAFLDGYHAIVTSQWFDQLWPSPPPQLIPWSWNASRIFLALMMFLSWLAWRREVRLGVRGAISPSSVYISVTLLTLSAFVFFAVTPLPRAYYPEFAFGRPEEFASASLFLLALIGYLSKGAWRKDSFEHWIVLSLIVGFVCQAAFMSSSFRLYDTMFDVAHLLKKASYICVLIGLLVSLMQVLRQAKRDRLALAASEEQYRLLIQRVDGYAIIMVDQAGLVTSWNEGAERIMGYTTEDALGKPMSIFFTPEAIAADKPDILLRQAAAQGQVEDEGWRVRKDGSHFFANELLSTIHNEVNQLIGFSKIIRDITEQKARERLAVLRHQLADLTTSGSQEQMLKLALETAEQITESRISFFCLVDENQNVISLRAWSTGAPIEMSLSDDQHPQCTISGAGHWADCLRRSAPVIDNDAAARQDQLRSSAGLIRLVRQLTVPVMQNDRPAAVVGIANKPRNYEAQDVALLTSLAEVTFDFLERLQAEQRVRFMAFNDALTGLPNRLLLEDRLSQALALSRRSNRLLAVCYLDLDEFKCVNDHLGHQAGDRLLVEFAQRMQRMLREGDTLARLGGDEFVILLNGLSDINQCEEILHRVLLVAAQPFDLDGHQASVSASIGATLFPDDPNDPDILLRHADQAMYQAKGLGKNRFKLYS